MKVYVIQKYYDNARFTNEVVEELTPELQEVLDAGGEAQTKMYDLYIDVFDNYDDAINFMYGDDDEEADDDVCGS